MSITDVLAPFRAVTRPTVASPRLPASFAAMSPELAQDVLVPTAAVLQAKVAGLPDGPDREAARAALQHVREQLTRTAERSEQPLPGRFAAWAEEYERLRATLEVGPERTRRMAELTERARAAIIAAQDGRAWLAERLDGFATAREGERALLLAALSAAPLRAGLGPVLQAVRGARSPFEQYHALIAARALVDVLDRPGRARLRGALESELGDPTTYLSAPSDRRSAARWCLQTLDAG